MSEGILGAAQGLFGGVAFIDVVPRFKDFGAEAKAELAKTASGMESEAKAAFAGVGKAATTALLGAAVAIGAASLELADKFEASHARLESALHNIGTSYEAERSQILANDKALEKLGFTNADTEASLSSLALVTKNTSTAIRDEHLAADIARGRHIDLAAATSLLVKVESGHVALLGRLGINTKDATGATITQEEAIKRLTALYGGNATRYADTFAGKMQVLRATSEDLGKNIGLRLIPVLETLAADTLAVVEWFEKHKVAAAAVAAVVGGPLVAAMVAYTHTQAVAFAESVANGFSLIADAAAAAVGPLLGLDTAIASIGVTEAGAATASAGFLASLAGVAAVAAPFAVLAGGVLVLKRDLDDNAKAAGSWAGAHIAAAKRSGDELKSLEAVSAHLHRQMKAGWEASIGPVHLFTSEHAKDAANRAKAIDKEISSLKQHAKDMVTDHAAIEGAIAGDADAVSKAATAAGQAAAKAWADLRAAIGPDAAKIEETYGLTASQAEQLAKVVNSTTQAMATSFDSATSLVQHFDGQASVSFKDVNKYLKEQVKATEDWSTNLQALADSGINGGLLKQVADAGPKAAPLVKALLDDVRAGNLDAINEMEAGMESALAAAEGAVTGAETDFFNAGLGLGWSVVHGYAQSLSHLSSIVPTAKDVNGNTVIGIAGVNVGGPPHKARGGFSHGPESIIWGEAGQELILPLTDRPRSYQLLEQSGLLASTVQHAQPTASAPGGRGGGDTYHFHFPNYLGSKDELAKTLSRVFEDHRRSRS
ncbi:MAG TPA: hypothetical protein VHD87_08145 [Acidimicrobiales bacterium]|nr:hypothetical protein [Acidimicrobiales bacterium]